jgi:hypothetical protein
MNRCPSVIEYIKLPRTITRVPKLRFIHGKKINLEIRVNEIISHMISMDKKFRKEYLMCYLFKKKCSTSRLVDVHFFETPQIISNPNYGRMDEVAVSFTFIPLMVKLTKQPSIKKMIHHGYVSLNKRYILPIMRCNCVTNNECFHFYDSILHQPFKRN